MQFFLDSADINEISEIYDTGIIDGVTTNPSLMSKTSKDAISTIIDICKIVKGDVSIEVVSNNFDDMIKQGEKLLEIADNIVIKLPITWNGIRACKYFSARAVKVNMTLCFSVNQALIAAKAGAYYVSPFVGRLDDIGHDGMQLIKDIKQMYHNQSLHSKILVASVRSAIHIQESAIIGADVITASGKIILNLLNHPLTSQGLDKFNNDWMASNLNFISA